jgi:hypothetical protein
VMIRKNTEAMQKLLEAKKVHLRPDFEPWIPVDMDMERDFRNQIFEKASGRFPFVPRVHLLFVCARARVCVLVTLLSVWRASGSWHFGVASNVVLARHCTPPFQRISFCTIARLRSKGSSTGALLHAPVATDNPRF